MTKFINIFLVLIFTAIGISAQEKMKTSDTSKDEAVVRANAEQMVKGWNMKSGAEFAKPFAADADYVIINGVRIKGRDVIAKGHQRIFDTIYKDSTLSYSIEQVRFLRPDVAVVHMQTSLEVTQENSTRTGNARITLVMTKNKDKWEIAAFQNTQVEQQEN